MTVAPQPLPTTPVRLAKRVAELKPCSRSEAERLIEGGWVQVDGQVVEVPAHKVLNENITIDPQATAIDLGPVTFVLHKPPGYEAGLGQATAGDPRGSRSRGGPSALACLTASAHAGTLPGGQPVRLLQKHFRDLVALAPLPTQASGLAVFSQDWRVQRKLTEDADLVEQEVMVVAGAEVTPAQLQRLCHGLSFNGRALPPIKVSISSQNADTTRLRFALKGIRPGQVASMLESVGLRMQSLQRIRVGRIALAGLAIGQWRFLQGHERF